MVVRHNISALNANRQLGINNESTAKNLEKLSSGYRINRSADDAAGLAISEKMRGQIRGLNMAEQNVSNAVQLIQTAEGGLQETHAILHRMRELAVQSANGTYDNEVDRYNLNKELDALKSEINRISQSTHYNGINLLDGTLGADTIEQLAGGSYQAGGVTIQCEDGSYYALMLKLEEYGFPVGTMNAGTFVGALELEVYSAGMDGASANLIINHGSDEDGNDTAYLGLQVGDVIYTATLENGVYNFYSDSSELVASLTCYINKGAGTTTALTSGMSGILAGISLQTGGPVDLLGTAGDSTSSPSIANTAVGDSHPLYNALFGDENSAAVFQIGANGALDQRTYLGILNLSTVSIGTLQATAYNATGSIADISVAYQDDANDAIDIIDAAVNQISAVRADLGAMQNRLEHTLNNLGVTKENLTAAESTIRDVDMAGEMMEFTKNSILVQAAQAMLAQANMLPQGVLQLLQ